MNTKVKEKFTLGIFSGVFVMIGSISFILSGEAGAWIYSVFGSDSL